MFSLICTCLFIGYYFPWGKLRDISIVAALMLFTMLTPPLSFVLRAFIKLGKLGEKE